MRKCYSFANIVEVLDHIFNYCLFPGVSSQLSNKMLPSCLCYDPSETTCYVYSLLKSQFTTNYQQPPSTEISFVETAIPRDFPSPTSQNFFEVTLHEQKDGFLHLGMAKSGRAQLRIVYDVFAAKKRAAAGRLDIFM